MGHRHHGARVFLQGPLQPGHRLGIEVVRGLVQQEQVRLRQQESAQGDPPALAARQRGDVGVPRRQPEGIHGDLERPLQIPGAGRVDLGLQIGLFRQQRIEIGVGFGERCADLVEAVHEALDLPDPVGDVAGHVLGGVQLWLLRQVADREAGREAGLAGEPVILSSHDLQQRGLPRAVRADHPDLRPGIEGEIDALQDLPVRGVEPLEIAHGVDELGCHAKQCDPAPPLAVTGPARGTSPGSHATIRERCRPLPCGPTARSDKLGVSWESVGMRTGNGGGWCIGFWGGSRSSRVWAWRCSPAPSP